MEHRPPLRRRDVAALARQRPGLAVERPGVAVRRHDHLRLGPGTVLPALADLRGWRRRQDALDAGAAVLLADPSNHDDPRRHVLGLLADLALPDGVEVSAAAGAAGTFLVGGMRFPTTGTSARL